jgi:hypothetical protein
MNIEDLATCSWETIASLSYDELSKVCEPFYGVTRPELITKPSPAVQQSKQMSLNLSPQQMQALKLAEENGLDVALLMKSFAKNGNERIDTNQ